MRVRIRRSRSGLTRARIPRSATPRWPGPVGWMVSISSGMRLTRSPSAAFSRGNPIALPFVYGCRRAKRQQPDHRPNLEPHRLSVRQAKHVVIEPVLFVPHSARTDSVHRAGDQQKLHDVIRGQFLISRVVGRKLAGDFEHVLAEQSDPPGAVGLFQITAGWRRRAAIEDTDIVEPKKPAFEKAPAKAILAVQPPAEI